MKALPEYADFCLDCGGPCGFVFKIERGYMRRRSDCCGAPTIARPLSASTLRAWLFETSQVVDGKEAA